MQPLVHIDLFGGLTVRRGESVMSRFATRKAAGLLAYLAYHVRHRHPREELSERLWPDAPPEVSRHRLRQALTSLRHQLGPGMSASATVLEADRSHIGIYAGGVEVDTDRFAKLLEAARLEKRPDEQSRLLAQATALYRGELLPGYYDDWVLTERERLALAFLDASCRLALLLEGQGDIAGALDVLYRALASDPLHEDAHVILIRFHAAMGRAGAARMQFAALERLLRDHLGLAPDEATRSLVAGLPVGAKPRVVGIAPPPPLPPDTPSSGSPTARSFERPCRWVYLTRFFGREPELEALGRMLTPGSDRRSRHRLVSLVGGGGCGKTRLAVEAANALEAQFCGRVWIVPLADLREAERVPRAIVEAIGIYRTGDQDPMGLLVQGLASTGPCLVVLDNAEQLVPGIAETVGELLSRLPGLACLVTSRRSIGLPGERVIVVAPLPVPAEHGSTESVAGCVAVQLLVDRIQSRRPDFQVTPANYRDVAALCAHLEGIPLAIELATAWSVSLTPRQMLQRMRRRLDIGGPGRTTAPERHRSLRSTLEWSRRLLGAPERDLFARLSVFAGGCDLDAVRPVCWALGSGDYAASERDELQALSNLVDLSLLSAEERDGEMRYRMPEIVREYAAELMGEAQARSLSERHADWFARLADTASGGQWSATQIAWLRRLDADRPNLDAALEWSIANSDAPRAIRIAGALGPYWETRALHREGHLALSRALALGGEASLACARALIGLAFMAIGLGDGPGARLAATEAIEILDAYPEAEKAQAWLCLGVVEWRDRQIVEAERWFAMAQSAGDPCVRASARNGLGKIALYRDHLDEARSHHRASAALARSAGAPIALIAALVDAGMTAWFQRDLDPAEELLTEAFAVCREAGDRLNTIRALWALGNVARGRGHVARAAELYHECLEVGGLAGAGWSEPYIWEAAAHLCLNMRCHRDAAQLLGAASVLRDPGEVVRLLAVEMRELDELRQAVRAGLGAVRHAAAWATGGAMTREAAQELAVRTFAAARSQ